MFDIGFWEMILVGVVSLVVFGPERLPRVAKETALWIRKARSMVASVKAEINDELQLQEMRESLLDEQRKIGKPFSTALASRLDGPRSDKTAPEEPAEQRHALPESRNEQE